MHLRSCHILIIGAGPAGCTAAILLGRAGFEVTLVEQSKFPRDKVCGECISALGAEVLSRAGLFDALVRTVRPNVFHRATIFAGTAATTVRLAKPMYGVSRAASDAFLLEQARQYCAIRQPARCERLNPEALHPLTVDAESRDRQQQGPNDRVTANVRDLVSNIVEKASYDWVILADGKAALLPMRPALTGSIGIKSHWVGAITPRDSIELFAVGGGYGGLAIIEDGRCNASFSVPAERLKASGGNLEALFAALRRENQVLDARLAGAERVSPWLSAPLPRFGVRSTWAAGVIPVGNAAAAIEPIGGEGIGLALHSAEMAAEEIISAHHRSVEPDLAALRLAYRRLWRRRAGPLAAAGRAIRHPGAAAAVRLLNAVPSMATAGLRLIGK